MKAILRAIRITPKKANLIAGMIRKKPAKEALTILKYTPKKAAKLIYKLLTSAMANASNNFKQDENTLIVKEVVVNKGPTFKRGVPVSRGRVYPILKRTSNIIILLEVDENAAKPGKKASKKAAKVAEAAAEEAGKTDKKESGKTKKAAKKTTK
jgi:large subunit ribosomal protein L22